ncbi:hypothetical protein EV182_005266, partial [Spiromyces aspiralis]
TRRVPPSCDTLTRSPVTDDRVTHRPQPALFARQYLHRPIGPRPPRIPTTKGPECDSHGYICGPPRSCCSAPLGRQRN